MRILVISAAFPPQSAPEADYAFHLCGLLKGEGHTVRLLTSRKDATAEIDGVETRALFENWNWKEMPLLAKEIRSAEADAILFLYLGWVYHWHPMATFVPTLANWFAPRARVTTIFFNRYGANVFKATLFNRVVQKLFAWLSGSTDLIYEYGSLLQRSDSVIALSEQHAAVLREVWPDVTPRLKVTPSLPLIKSPRPLERQAGRERLRLSDDELAIVFFGYVYPAKGVETLIEACRRLRDRGYALRLIIVGGTVGEGSNIQGTYLNELKELAKWLRMDDKIVWTGSYEWKNPEPAQYLAAADIFALPFDAGVSLNNSSFATVCQFGAPVVSTTRSDLESAFEDGENVLLCSPQDPKALEEAIRKIIHNPLLNKKLTEGALQLSHTTFSWKRAVHDFLAVARKYTAPA